MKSVGERAEALVHQGRLPQALAILNDAATRNEPDAHLTLAMWHLAGQYVSRDLGAARLRLRKARELGHLHAAALEIALTANGSGAPADWVGARALLEQTARRDPTAAGQLALLNKMTLTADGYPIDRPVSAILGRQPTVRHFVKLFTPEECAHVAHAAVDMLQPATVVDPRTGRNVAHPVRTSDGAVIGPARETLVVQALNRRLATATDTDVRQGEALSVLRYRPGQQFRPHLDAIDGAGNQRVQTVLVYLNADFKGGATFFNHSGLRIKPETGDAIVFDNTHLDGAIDRTTQHAGEPVTTGVKWLATRWIRARPFSIWSGPESV